MVRVEGKWVPAKAALMWAEEIRSAEQALDRIPVADIAGKKLLLLKRMKRMDGILDAMLAADEKRFPEELGRLYNLLSWPLGAPDTLVAPFSSPIARQAQSEWAQYLNQPETLTNTIGMKLKLIPAGEYMMGSPESEKDRPSDEGPVHRVRITRPFFLGVYEVTQEQYERVMGENPSNFKGSTLPVERVSWDDAVEFCRKLSATEGRTYRLPTEAEWEYACRAGTTTPFSFGRVLNGDEANCDGNYPYGTETKGPYKQTTVSVGSYRPNAWGLYDMHGNVWEWCSDWYADDYYANSPGDDPAGASAGSSRVNRGGGWDSDASYCRSANRLRSAPDGRDRILGFRVAQVASE